MTFNSILKRLSPFCLPKKFSFCFPFCQQVTQSHYLEVLMTFANSNNFLALGYML